MPAAPTGPVAATEDEDAEMLAKLEAEMMG